MCTLINLQATGLEPCLFTVLCPQTTAEHCAGLVLGAAAGADIGAEGLTTAASAGTYHAHSAEYDWRGFVNNVLLQHGGVSLLIVLPVECCQHSIERFTIRLADLVSSCTASVFCCACVGAAEHGQQLRRQTVSCLTHSILLVPPIQELPWPKAPVGAARQGWIAHAARMLRQQS